MSDYKVCTKCRQPKPRSAFGSRPGSADGKRSRCKACERDDRAEYLSDPENKAKANRSSLAYYRRNRPKALAATRKWRLNNLAARNVYQWRRTLRVAFGITPEDYGRLLTAQGGCCAVCRRPTPGGGKKRWFVDHDHGTGKVRGLLCAHCNMGLGQFGDDADRLRRAADYVERGGVS